MKLQPRHGYLAAGLISGLTLGVGGTLAFSASAAPGGDEYGKLNVFSSAYAMILSRYVHEIPAEKLIGAAVRGMVKELDPHCSFYDPKQFKSLKEDNNGQYVGVGIEMEIVPEGVLVKRVIKGGPAIDAGMLDGDRIDAIDGASMAGKTRDGRGAQARPHPDGAGQGHQAPALGHPRRGPHQHGRRRAADAGLRLGPARRLQERHRR
jgi:C-terminal processing protease CtpA/Prc